MTLLRTPRHLFLAPIAALTMVGSLTLVGSPVSASAVEAKPTYPSGFAQRTLVGGLKAPIDMAFSPDGRLFIAEQKGRLRVVRANGTLTTFLNIKTDVDSTAGRGLLGLAFDPNFASNGFVYINYTKKDTETRGPHTVVARVTARGNKAVPGSLVQLLRLDKQRTPNHTGGAIAFGPDGHLYVSTGDNEQPGLSQKRTSTMGKILRIRKNGTIPKSNPFYERNNGRKRAIWARGLRNPFKLDFSSAGQMLINDVGEDTWEEINPGRRGANYGWSVNEGPTGEGKYTSPVFTYGHGSSGKKGCAITAGTFYEPQTTQFPPAYDGDYFYADYCSGWIRRFDPANGVSSKFAKGFTKPVLDLEVSDDGALFALLRGGKGKVIRIGR